MQSTSSRLAVAQPCVGCASAQPGGRIGVGAIEAAGGIQACGVEHRRAAGHRFGEDVTAGTACRRTASSAAQVPVSFAASAKLTPTWNTCGFGLEHRGQAGDEILGCEEPPALAEVQPVTVRRSGRGSARAGRRRVCRVSAGELEESVAIQQFARSSAERPAARTRNRPTRGRSAQQCRNEFSVCSVRARSGPAIRLTVTSASRASPEASCRASVRGTPTPPRSSPAPKSRG